MSFQYLLCDLDNTLYSALSGLLDHIDCRIDCFIGQKLNLAPEEIAELRQNYWQKYGTTLSGLVLQHQIKPVEYIDYVYNINIADFIKPDPILAMVLENIKLTKVIFSNSPKKYIERVLQVLDVERYFAKIYDIEFCNYLGKPNLSGFLKVLNDLGVKGEDCILVDDCVVNLQAAQQIKIVPIYLNGDPQRLLPYDIQTIYDLQFMVEKLFKERISA